MRSIPLRIIVTAVDMAGRFTAFVAAVIVVQVLLTALPTGAVGAQEGACSVETEGSLDEAKALFASECRAQERRDCDPRADGGWQCSSEVIGSAAPGGWNGTAQPDVPITPARDTTVAATIDRSGDCFSPVAADLKAAVVGFERSCSGFARLDCDPVAGGWRCSSGVIGTRAPGTMAAPADNGNLPGTDEEPVTSSELATSVDDVAPVTEATALPGAPSLPAVPVQERAPGESANRSVGRLGGNDLLVLHYDNCPDPDDGQALAAGFSVVRTLGLSAPLVVNGTCGDLIRDRYQPESLALARGIWGSGVLDADGERDAAVEESVSRWGATLANGARVWVAEGGQSDFTADVLARLSTRSPELDLARVTVVQHSAGNGAYNEDNSVRLTYVRATVTYQRVSNGNVGNNGTADLNQQSAFFVERARAGRDATAWNLAFDYLRPDCAVSRYTCKLDFSDTVELLWIVDDGQTRTVDDFARRYVD